MVKSIRIGLTTLITSAIAKATDSLIQSATRFRTAPATSEQFDAPLDPLPRAPGASRTAYVSIGRSSAFDQGLVG